VKPGDFAVEGSGTACLVPVAALPSPQQRELSAELRKSLQLIFVHPEGPPGDAVESLEAVRKACGHDRVGLLGTSMWALLATAYARRFPEQTAFLVLVGAPPHAAGLEDAQRSHWESNASPERKALLEERLCALEAASAAGAEESVAAAARAWAPMGWFDRDFDPSGLLGDIVIDHERTTATVRSFASISLPAVLPQLACPVLRIHGAHDFIVPAPLWSDHQQLGAHVRSCVFDRSAHHPAFEERERFDREVLAWIADQGAAP
jgi:proline iminopeptidase